MNFILCVFLAAALPLHFPLTSPVSSFHFNEYYPGERDALLQLRNSMTSSFNLHSNWTGPPCIGNLSRWFGVVCSDWHVTHLVLEGIQLSGSLPPAFLCHITFLTTLSFTNNSIFGPLPNLTSLAHLQSVLLSYNRFAGSIPSDYIELPSLQQLELQQNYLQGQIPPFNQSTLIDFNVSYNYLQGSIPETDVLRRFPETSFSNLDVCGFPLKLCPVPPPPPAILPPPPIIPPKDRKKKLPIWSIVSIAVAAALITFLLAFICFCCYKQAHKKETAKEPEAGATSSAGWTDKKLTLSQRTEDPERRVELEFFDRNIPVFDLDDLLRSSAEVLGKGKLGTTYKSNLESNAVVAVKRVKNMNCLSKKEFIQQMQLLGKLRHENLVHIISFYYSKEEKLVIYEYVPNGNLFELLHDNRGVGRVPLNWAARLSVVKDVARGLAFLHRSLPSHKVPHANLKSSNVLIHQNGPQSYRSKLTNYGFLPLLPSKKYSQRLAIGRSPEFSSGKKLTHKADVYCFGIILLEVITGRIPSEVSPGNDEREDDLSDWVKTAVNNDWSTDILDVEIMATREGHDDMLKLTEIALECTDVAPEKRPKMTEVLRRIEEIEFNSRAKS
ncbi:probable leucine-rich repeat receptor-like protein kinase At1g68400 isoform X2 [Ricinus communis]|uniref:Serine-threonine protein kinase, plant-type, putative n=1 Tax=Ricinus communis TaxID=3988 RepID=B9SI43_RICCO|nr:probable leucine-rich repeat receptor-like protein kinase At1g68400 isoform X2 [Ricinus communis]EEF36780.1 serine-threonine protein kinase, plant-type, putative [Ricinus communis]|eukprot:XP_002525662.1 probable leucine-rich repeat receptor-like protein kinase At1g68400 isoform X2 [Ricinus communis]